MTLPWFLSGGGMNGSGFALRRRELEDLLGDPRRPRRAALLAPIRAEDVGHPARIHDRAREDVVADGPALLDDHDLVVGEAVAELLREGPRGGEAGGAGADDEDVDIHPIAFGHGTSVGLRSAAQLAGRLAAEGSTVRCLRLSFSLLPPTRPSIFRIACGGSSSIHIRSEL